MTIQFASALPAALRRPSLVSLFIALALSACGGGGGSDATNPQSEPQPPPVLPNPPPEPPVPPPPVVSKGTVSLLTGSLGGAGNLDGTGANARFFAPAGLTVDAAGNLYVADLGNRKIRKITRAGVVTTFAGSGALGYTDGAAAQATFCYPTDVAADPSGNVFVVEQPRVRKITASGHVTTVAGAAPAKCDFSSGTAFPKNPSAVAVDGQGIAYIADSFPGAVYTLTPSGVLTRLAGSQDQAQPTPELSFPTGIAVDAARNVYVANSYETVARITSSGQLSTLLAPSAALGTPQAIAADTVGNLYVADPNHHVVRKITPAGAISTIAGVQTESAQGASIDGPLGIGRLSSPVGIAVAADGTVFVSDRGGNTIRQIDPVSGNLSTLAGLAAPSDRSLGDYHATDAAGNVFIAVKAAAPAVDYGVQRIAPDGTATTLLAGGLVAPRGMAVNTAGDLYVVDNPRPGDSPCIGCGINTVVYKITPQGVMTILAGSLTPSSINGVDGTGSAAVLRSAQDLAIDKAGNLYFGQAYIYGFALRKITPDGTVSTLDVGLLDFPDGVAADAAGNLYVGTCPGYIGRTQTPSGGAILKIAPGGKAVVFAGSTTEFGFRDGVGAEARFSGDRSSGTCLRGLTLDAAGNVYVADTGNNAVRKITPDGTVSTVVGQPGVSGSTLGELPASLWGPTDVSFDGAGNLFVGSVNAILKVKFNN